MRQAIRAGRTWGFLTLLLALTAGPAHAQYFMGGYGLGGVGTFTEADSDPAAGETWV